MKKIKRLGYKPVFNESFQDIFIWIKMWPKIPFKHDSYKLWNRLNVYDNIKEDYENDNKFFWV